jgi:hypothetical protein
MTVSSGPQSGGLLSKLDSYRFYIMGGIGVMLLGYLFLQQQQPETPLAVEVGHPLHPLHSLRVPSCKSFAGLETSAMTVSRHGKATSHVKGVSYDGYLQLLVDSTTLPQPVVTGTSMPLCVLSNPITHLPLYAMWPGGVGMSSRVWMFSSFKTLRCFTRRYMLLCVDITEDNAVFAAEVYAG